MNLSKRAGLASRCIVIALISLPSSSVADADAKNVPGLDLDAYRGKVLVLDFWASWCGPCRRSLPWLESMQQKYANDGLVIIGINEDNEAADAKSFLEDFPVSFEIRLDPAGDLARRFDLVAMPSTYVIDRDGQVAARHLGFKTAKTPEYEATLQRLLGATTGARHDNDQ